MKTTNVPKVVNCICGHRHAHKSRCKVKPCECRYGTDNRRASDRIIAKRGMPADPRAGARLYLTHPAWQLEGDR